MMGCSGPGQRAEKVRTRKRGGVRGEAGHNLTLTLLQPLPSSASPRALTTVGADAHVSSELFGSSLGTQNHDHVSSQLLSSSLGTQHHLFCFETVSHVIQTGLEFIM